MLYLKGVNLIEHLENFSEKNNSHETHWERSVWRVYEAISCLTVHEKFDKFHVCKSDQNTEETLLPPVRKGRNNYKYKGNMGYPGVMNLRENCNRVVMREGIKSKV